MKPFPELPEIDMDVAKAPATSSGTVFQVPVLFTVPLGSIE
jgi:hypothetical protein